VGGKASRNKGHNEERWVVNAFRAAGLSAERNLSQTRDKGCDVLTDKFAVECKRVERLDLPRWIAQAEAQAEQHGLKMMLTFKQSRKPRYMILRFDEGLELLQADAEAAAIARGEQPEDWEDVD
jgi:hypothetical protein